MTKKKRNHPDVDEILSRPWCYYCLSVHMSQVHKENLTAVDNALPNRAGLDIEIFGMEGIPEDIVQQHTQRVLTNYHQGQTDRQGGGGAQGSNASAPKKPKLESVSDIKKRLAEHKAAKLAGEKENGGSSGGTTPKPAASVVAQAQPQAPSAASPSYSGYQQPPYAAPPTNGSYNQSPSYAQPPAVAASAPYQATPAYAPAVSPPQVGGYGHVAVPQPGQPGYGQVPPVSYPPQHYPQPSQSPFQPQQPPMGYPPQPSFSPPPYQAPYSGQPYPGQAGMPPRPFGPGSSAPGYPQQMPNHRAHSPAMNANFPAPVRTGSVSLPSAPGLPQRPAFGAPPVNAFQFQQLHQGQMPAPQAHAMPPQYPPHQPPFGVAAAHTPPQSHVPAPPNNVGDSENASTLDDLIKDAQDKAAADTVPATTAIATPPVAAPAPAKEEVSEEKGAKKDKEKEKPKSTRLVYSDNETSPEERMAMMAKYAFTPAQKTIMV
ncbi:hypothetical protein EDD37DRAFT_609260 [Exophiala viscosa]|uniref:uncharacterized protein n=1 Tax=Exophiala viscosa TaxID=2486360 RepID=UPI00219A43EF|nr:hypothetical protein EDD37DRAFT_609260 [Exophiala viscosa]